MMLNGVFVHKFNMKTINEAEPINTDSTSTVSYLQNINHNLKSQVIYRKCDDKKFNKLLETVTVRH